MPNFVKQFRAMITLCREFDLALLRAACEDFRPIWKTVLTHKQRLSWWYVPGWRFQDLVASPEYALESNGWYILKALRIRARFLQRCKQGDAPMWNEMNQSRIEAVLSRLAVVNCRKRDMDWAGFFQECEFWQMMDVHYDPLRKHNWTSPGDTPVQDLLGYILDSTNEKWPDLSDAECYGT